MNKINASQKIILDADVVIHFLKADKLSMLPDIFDNKLYMPDVVFEETFHGDSKTQVENLLRFKFVQELSIKGDKQILVEYVRLKNKGYGKGESACMAYCLFNKDVIASSNLKDIKDYCNQNNITYLTTMDFLEEALLKSLLSIQECDKFISQVLSKGSKLPCKSMAEYARYK